MKCLDIGVMISMCGWCVIGCVLWKCSNVVNGVIVVVFLMIGIVLLLMMIDVILNGGC